MKYVKIEGGKKLSPFVSPMKAQLSDMSAFDNKNWIFEIKWDGYRAIAETGKDQCRLYSRNGLSFDKAYPKVFDALKLITQKAVLDGEIVVYDEHGKPSFQKLQNYKNTDRFTIQYLVFDCLALDGRDLTHLPLLERKSIVKGLIPKSDVIFYCDHVEEYGKAFFEEIKKIGLEGMIAKKKVSTYYIGKRTADWLKIKNVQSQEAVIVGFTEPKGSRSHFGSLLLAVKTKNKLTSIGNVGTGFTDRSLKELYQKLLPLRRNSSPLDVPIKETPDITWVEPLLVCNIKFTEITEDGSVRHPVFQGLRVDKAPSEVSLEKKSKPRK
jgi:bifunctional non-homologous end joining protein LigD